MNIHRSSILLIIVLCLEKSLLVCGIYCPNAADILPCTCTEDGIDFVNIDCSSATSEDDIEIAFLADFPQTNLTTFTIIQNTALTGLTKNLFIGVNFQYVVIQNTNIVSVTSSFFASSYNTLLNLDCSRNLLVDFPLDVLSRFKILLQLDLNHNALTSLPKLYSTTIQSMNFASNSLEDVADFAFNNCSAIVNIFLDDNVIPVLPSSTFIGAKTLEMISVGNNQINILRPGTFSALEKLTTIILSGNPLTAIEDAAFVDLPSLYNLEIDFAHLISIGREIYFNVPNIDLFSLSSSILQYIEPYLFVGFEADFISIYFDDNDITTVEKDAFTGVDQGEIFLNNNNISVIEAQAFRDLFMSTLSLSENMITTLDEIWLGSVLEAENQVDVQLNPLECGCDLLWLFQTPVYMNQLINNPTCANGTLLSELDFTYYFTNC